MIRLLRVKYLEDSDAIADKIDAVLDGIFELEDMPEHTDLGAVIAVAAEMKEYSWEPYTKDCVYIITRSSQWSIFENGLLLKAGVKYQAEDVLDDYYSGKIKLIKLRRKIDKYLRFWLTTDEVLDKILKHGMSSLTPTDYKVLKDVADAPDIYNKD